jgi:hypothetical protein
MQIDIHLLQKRLANVTIDASLLRNQGSPGVIAASREYCSRFDFSRLKNVSKEEYKKQLDAATLEIKESLPLEARTWGAARKVLNVFFLQACLDYFISKKYNLENTIPHLEVPLDSFVAKELLREARKRKVKLPKWNGIKHLTPEDSREFERLATQIAAEKGISRAFLDLIYWRGNIKIYSGENSTK